MIQLQKQAQEIGIMLTEKQIAQFQTYYDRLIETNKVMNLTAITELEEVISKHFIDSLLLIQVYPDIAGQKLKVLDLGTGAGFPGIPLKIAFPSLQITLMDSLNKRVKFLKSVIDELKLCDIEAVHSRAEEAARNTTYREQFDLCVSRAVANLATLSEYTLPFVKIGGMCIPYKAAGVEEEVDTAKKAIQILGGKLTTVKKVALPETEIERSFILIDKVKKTPKTYPRKPGTASKEPIH